MARVGQIEYVGALYHALSRGNPRQEIFADDEDGLLFLDSLAEMAQRFEVEKLKKYKTLSQVLGFG